MDNDTTKATVGSGAERMRRHRYLRKVGLRSIPARLYEHEISALVAYGLLDASQRQNPTARNGKTVTCHSLLGLDPRDRRAEHRQWLACQECANCALSALVFSVKRQKPKQNRWPGAPRDLDRHRSVPSYGDRELV